MKVLKRTLFFVVVYSVLFSISYFSALSDCDINNPVLYGLVSPFIIGAYLLLALGLIKFFEWCFK
jgi:hypothetical protein